MFNNLIESSSHAREFKRRGSFLLFTTAAYVLLFVLAGVMSIYAYDAQLEEPANEITMLSPIEAAPNAPANPPKVTPEKGNSGREKFVERAAAMASVNRPDIAPSITSAKANTSLPVPDSGHFMITGRDYDPGTSGGIRGPGIGSDNHGTDRSVVVSVGTPPPLEPIRKPVTKVVSKGVITSQALVLPKPQYPPLAKQMRIQGMVSVQVLIDEKGKVISAKAISGNPALVPAAQKAALEARFSPTLLSEQPVKVSGVITYNFVLE